MTTGFVQRSCDFVHVTIKRSIGTPDIIYCC